MQSESILAVIGHGYRDMHGFFSQLRQRSATEIGRKGMIEIRLEPCRPVRLHAEDPGLEQLLDWHPRAFADSLEGRLIFGREVAELGCS
jgi:hypothetical protein